MDKIKNNLDIENKNNIYDKIKIIQISKENKNQNLLNNSCVVAEIEKIDIDTLQSKLDINNAFSNILIKDYPQFFNEVLAIKNSNPILKESDSIESIYYNLSKLNIDIDNLINLYEIFDQYEDYYPELKIFIYIMIYL